MEAFGKVHSETSSTVDTAFGYTGRYFDDDTGLQWNLNRWYDPLVGRWLSEDPIGFAAGDPNLYRYVGNSPGAFVDPSGLANLWNVFTWGIDTPQQGWGGFFNPFADSNPAWAVNSAFLASAGSGAASVGLGIAEPGLIVVDTGRAAVGIMTGTTQEEFNPWSQYGEYSTNRILAGGTASDVRREATPGLVANVCTFGGYGTYQGALEYSRSGDPDQWRRAAGMQLLIAGTVRAAQESPGAARTCAGETTRCYPRGNPNDILGSDPGGLLGQEPSAPYIPEPGCMEWEFSAPRPTPGPRAPVSCPGKISGNPANRRLPTGVPLKDGSWWRERYYRITPEDARAYQDACADRIGELHSEQRWFPDEAAQRQYHRQEMSRFRTEWLENFLRNRKY